MWPVAATGCILCICVCICETVALWSACLRHLQPDAASRCQQVSDMREQLFGEETAGLLFASFHPQRVSPNSKLQCWD